MTTFLASTLVSIGAVDQWNLTGGKAFWSGKKARR